MRTIREVVINHKKIKLKIFECKSGTKSNILFGLVDMSVQLSCGPLRGQVIPVPNSKSSNFSGFLIHFCIVAPIFSLKLLNFLFNA
jgi:hypothetical protein